MLVRSKILSLSCGLLVAANALAATTRDQEIAECRSGEIATWNDGADRRAIAPSLRFTYRHEEAPPWFGLMAHSRRCVDVLSYYHDGKGGRCFSRDPAGMRGVVEYRHVLPTACDIERCRIANGLPAPAGRWRAVGPCG